MSNTPAPMIDVLVIGAGPAGGQCARALARNGWKVTLVEQHSDFDKNNFSSAGTLHSILAEFDLPRSIIGSEWKRLDIVTSKNHFQWMDSVAQGLVLDFAKLRAFLAEDMQAHQGILLLQHKYIRHQVMPDHVVVTLLNRITKKTLQIQARIVVDATGPRHSVINQDGEPSQAYSTAVGLEYLIRAPTTCHAQDTLTFFLGDQWMPEGYGWIFPMEAGIYKVGVAVYLADPQQKSAPLPPYLHKILEDYLQLEHYDLIDQHGGGVRYCHPQYEHAYRGRILAIGDAMSCINALGGEGIRHGMRSANLAAEYINKSLHEQKLCFALYRKAILRQFSRDWRRCDRYSKMGYRLRAENRLDIVFRYLQKMPLAVLVDVLFHYRFGHLKWLMFKRFIRRLIKM